MPRLLNLIMGRAALLLSPDIDDTASGLEYEKQFTGDDPDDSDIHPDNDGSLKIGDDTAAPAPPAPPAATPAPPAPPAPPADPAKPVETGADPDDDTAAPPAPPAPPAAPAAPAAAPAADGPAAAPAAEEFEPYVPPPAGPVLAAPANADELIAAAAQERNTALKQFTDGDIDEAAYQAVQERTIATETDLRAKLASDDAVQRFHMSQVQERFNTMHAETINGWQAAGIKATPENVGEFNTLVKYYADKAVADGKTDGPGLVASKWALEQASRIFKLDKGVTGTAAPPPPAPAPAPAVPKVPTQAEADAARAIDRSKLPPTLAQAPLAADAVVKTEDRFAHIDKLEGVEQEKAIAMLSPTDLAAFLDK